MTQKDDFGNSCDGMSSEPYLYDSFYQAVKRNAPIPINEAGQCVIPNEIYTDKEDAQKINGSVPVSVNLLLTLRLMPFLP